MKNAEENTVSTANETWKPVFNWGLKGAYEVSSFGRIRRATGSIATTAGRIIHPSISRNYLIATLCVDGKPRSISVHKLVADAFIGPCPQGYQVDHIDGDKLNNSKSNLRYLTRSENVRAARELKQPKKGLRLKPEQVTDIRVLYSRSGWTVPELAAHYDKDYTTVWNIVKGRTYRIY